MKTNEKVREKIIAERFVFISDWCKKRGLSPYVSTNFDKAAAEWAAKNSFPTK